MNSMAEKLSKEAFKWIISLLMAVVIGIMGFQQAQISSVKGELTAYKSDMFQQITVIKTDMSKVSTNVEWLVRLLGGSDIIISE